jgi:hypothetical protein
LGWPKTESRWKNVLLSKWWLLVLLGHLSILVVFSGTVSLDKLRLFGKMCMLEPLTESQVAEIRPGDEVWLDLVILEVAEEESEFWAEEHVYGCRESWDGREDGEWWVSAQYSPPLRALRGESEVVVQLPEECPNGDYDTAEIDPNRYLGYRIGDRVSVLGTVQPSSSPTAEVEVEYHYGGTPSSHAASTAMKMMVALFGFGVAGLILLGLTWWGLSARNRRCAWDSLANARGLQRSSGFFTLGRIHGEIRGRDVEIRRRRGLGDGENIPSDVVMSLSLNSCMKPYKMRGQLAVEGWLLVLVGEEEVGDEQLDSLFVLQGVDRARWTALLSDPDVKEGLVELRENRVKVRMDEGQLEVSWPGLQIEVIETVLDLILRLAERMERVEGRGWAHAAQALSLELEMDAGSRWEIEDTAPYLGFDLRYHPHEKGWQTTMHMSLPDSVPSRWSLVSSQAGGTGQRSGDPVIDAQISLDGFEPGELEELIKMPAVTETLLAAIAGHGLLLEDQALVLRHSGLLPEPLELIRDARRLGEMLEALAR